MPIQLQAPVSGIDYSGNAVRLTTPVGTVTATTTIVTLPLAMIAAEKLNFNPPLPGSYLGALAGFRPGVVDKVWLQYNRPVFGDLGTTFVSQLVDAAGGGVLIANVYGQNEAGVLILDPTARQLESMGQAALVNFAIGAVNTAFPDATASAVIKSSVNPWGTDPWSLGSYSMALPGGVPGRLSLATPIDNRVFLAGDELSLNSHSSLLGAYQSAQAAVELVLTALGTRRATLGPEAVLAAYKRLGIGRTLALVATLRKPLDSKRTLT
jgi:monoamine oxidase